MQFFERDEGPLDLPLIEHGLSHSAEHKECVVTKNYLQIVKMALKLLSAENPAILVTISVTCSSHQGSD